MAQQASVMVYQGVTTQTPTLRKATLLSEALPETSVPTVQQLLLGP